MKPMVFNGGYESLFLGFKKTQRWFSEGNRNQGKPLNGSFKPLVM